MEDLRDRVHGLWRYLDVDRLRQRIDELEQELVAPDLWEDPQHAQKLSQEYHRLKAQVEPLESLISELDSAEGLLELAEAEDDKETLGAVRTDLAGMESRVQALEFQRMFSGEMDNSNAFMEIQAGAGGTEAQDWAEMLLRMYLRWCEQKGFQAEVMEASPGDEAGLKSATVKVTGDYAYGHLKVESGIHRLVRKSPFDSGGRRHTSFASVYVYPEVDESIEVDVTPDEVRTDTYRASGAGGQHVNTTDSAVRLTHLPTGIVVQSQSSRSQHSNRAEAWRLLRARLYERELQKQREKQAEEAASKDEIGWGNQIRSYVLDQSRIKDLRTGVEIGNTQSVLDGGLDPFIEAALKQGIEAGVATGQQEG
ncbi:peptide chain release factor 2 [Thiohalorhabdus sp.]|uniref:peptide chain release factor 2 n=1 Tax=Thiohalorhabdus sp. TaxID=3094134 RepID=UPI003FCDA8FF